MITQQQVPDVIGATAYSADGDKIGKVGDVYFDDQSGAPAWLTVNTGMFGTKETFIPTQATKRRHDGNIEIEFDKSMVKDAPRIESHDDFISEQQEAELYRYYGLPAAGLSGEGQAGPGRTAAAPAPTQPTPDRNAPRAAPNQAPGQDAMTRSEEHLRVGTERVETGRARLRKYVVTEQVQTTVPVSHEEVRVEREPITEANRDQALRGPAISEDEHEVTLHAERPVVQTVAEPVERVRLATEEVRGEEKVSGTVRKEQIEVDDASSNKRPAR